jgi:hypothetical protein
MRYYDWDFGFGFGRRHYAHGRRSGPRGGYGYDRGYRRGYDRGYRRPPTYLRPQPPREVGRGHAPEPFLPDEAYRLHPELEERSVHRGPWASARQGFGHLIDESDAAIARSVRENLYRDRYVDADALEVRVEDGVVTLRGEVDDFLIARYAWDDAWETEGVRGVLNQITVVERQG